MNTWKKKIIIIPQWSQYNCEVAFNLKKKKCHFIICWAPLCIHLTSDTVNTQLTKNIIFLTASYKDLLVVQGIGLFVFKILAKPKTSIVHTHSYHLIISLFSIPDYFFCISLNHAIFGFQSWEF